MALRPLPQPHLSVVDPERRQGVQVWREYWESVDRFLRSMGSGGAATLNLEFHGGGLALTTNTRVWLKVPFECEIQSWTATARPSGSVVVDLWVDSYANFPPTNGDSITAGNEISISSAVKNTDDTLTGWTKTIPAESYLLANIDSVTNVEDLLIEIAVAKT